MNATSPLMNHRHEQRGFSLVELMVAMAVGLVLSIAIASVMFRSESSRRTITSLNDANQSGMLASYELDRTLRSAGSGFMQSWNSATGGVLGCRLNASLNNNVILPRSSALPAPFATLSTPIRVAPVVVTQGDTSDVLTVMAGTAGFAEVGRRALSVGMAPAPYLRLVNTLGWKPYDLMLVSADTGECMIQQAGAVQAGTPDQLPLTGAYYAATGANGTSLASFNTGTAFAIALGRVVPDSVGEPSNPPQFQVIGVDPRTQTLVSYDLLTQGTPMPMAEGVVAIRALYGIDANLDGIKDDGWVKPTGNFDAATLMNGTAAAQASLRQIVSLRVAMVLRTSTIEKEVVNPAQIKLFQDLGEDQVVTHTLTEPQTHMRHRTIEFTVPLRNVLLLQ